LTAKPANDVAQHVGVYLQCVGIDGRHVTPSAERVQPHNRVADVQLGTGPVSLTQSVDAGDDDVRTKAPDVAPEGGNGAVGRHEQRQDVEAIEALPRLEPGVGARSSFDQRKGIGAVPRVAIDPRTIVGIERAAQTEQPVLPPRCANPFRASHTHDAVAGNAIRSNHCRR
jgi:hypothetical protein